MAPLIALAIPIAIFIAQSTMEYGWLELALGHTAVLFWTAVIAWAAASVISLRRRQWWALISAPLALYPVAGTAVLLFECARGNCL